MGEYKPTIGLEIHAELKTRTKMFCDSLNDPDEKHPNVNVCPVCLAHPGTLPTINKAAVEAVIKVSLALGGNINPITKFDRKNYFYPDLPKGYQISQYDQPLVVGGELLGVRIQRIHLEEDTGTLIHSEGSGVKGHGSSLVDFNRAGVPLMELVTEPVITSVEQAGKFARELQLILKYLGVSDADMELGQMRVEANVSLQDPRWKFIEGHGLKSGTWLFSGNTAKDPTTPPLNARVELKNINSFKAMEDAVRYELKRQKELLESGGQISQETRGWDEAKQKTISQRSKEEAHDYRYFPEPDLPPFETSIFELEKMKDLLPLLPAARRVSLKEESKENGYELNEKQIELLIVEPKRAEYFEKMISEILELCDRDINIPNNLYKKYSDVPNFSHNVLGRGYKYLTNDLQGLINSEGLEIEIGYEKVSPEHLAYFVWRIEIGRPEVNENDALGKAKTKEILQKMLETGLHPEDIIKSGDFGAISGNAELQLAVSEIVAEHIGPVNDYKKGKTQALQFLIGKAMARLNGKGDPKKLGELIERTIKSSEE